MKRGNAGLTGCCGGHGILGVHVNCPNPLPSEHTTPENDPGGANPFGILPSDNTLTSRGFAFAGREWNNIYGLPTHKDVRPEIWPPGAGGVMQWHAYAAYLA